MVTVLDLGSNSFILLVYERGKTILEKVYEVGLKSFEDDEEAYRAAKSVLTKIQKEIKDGEIYAFGTAFFREKPWLFHSLMNHFGLKGKILSEKEEAYLTYLSVGPTGKEDITVFDLGGGSLEIVKRDWFNSLELGTHVLNRIFDLYLPGAKDFENAVDYVSKRLPDFENAVGVGGSFVAIAALKLGKWDLNLLDGVLLNFEDLQQITRRLREMTFDQVLNMKVIPPARERTIIPGCAVATAIAKKSEIRVSTKGFRYTLAKLMDERLADSGVPGEI